MAMSALTSPGRAPSGCTLRPIPTSLGRALVGEVCSVTRRLALEWLVDLVAEPSDRSAPALRSKARPTRVPEFTAYPSGGTRHTQRRATGWVARDRIGPTAWECPVLSVMVSSQLMW
jgi:hypothetical protein